MLLVSTLLAEALLASMLFWLYYLVKAARLHRPVVELTERDRRNFLSLFKAIGQGDGATRPPSPPPPFLAPPPAPLARSLSLHSAFC